MRKRFHQEPEHKQVPFTTLGNGAVVTVDEGLVDILNLMRDLGLRTQFSCEGTDDTAYVLMDQKSASRFEKIMREAKLSFESENTASCFLDGPRSFDFCLSTKKRDVCRVKRVLFRRRFNLIREHGYFEVERLIQNAPHWLRTTYRWPVEMTPYVLAMLKEL